MYYSDELYHHGVLGMKWGVRRYRNADGSLTEAGKRRAIRKEFSKKNRIVSDKIDARNEQKELRNAGIKRGLLNDHIKKGATINRYSDKENEQYGDKRIYGSLTNIDRVMYGKSAAHNALSATGESIYLHELTSSKKLKVAKGEKVIKDLVKTYGDKEVKDAYLLSKQVNLRKNYYKLNRKIADPENANHWMYDHVMNNQRKLSSFLHNTLYDSSKSKEFYSKYSKKKYDAVVDPEDYSDGFIYPVIALNPGKSVKKKRTLKLI